MWTDLRDRPHHAEDISTPAAVKDRGNYEEAISEFEEAGWTYMPLPRDGEYYDVDEGGEPEQLDDDQFIGPDLHLLDVMEKLVDHPFLLVERESSYEIVNLSNLNKRAVKDFLYPLLSELAEELADRIEDHYEDSEDMFGMVNEFTLGTWYKARQGDVELHIAEFLTLSNMIGIIKGHGPLMDACGFETDDDVEKLNGVEKLRNRVMHGNRTLVNDTDMLRDHLGRIERAERIVKRLS